MYLSAETLPSCFSSHRVNKCLFHGLFSAMFFALLCFLLVISLFKMTHKQSARVLSSVPKCKKAMMCLRGKIHVLPKLLSGVSDSAVGCEFNVNESIIYINKVSLNRNTHKTRLCIDQLMKML